MGKARLTVFMVTVYGVRLGAYGRLSHNDAMTNRRYLSGNNRGKRTHSKGTDVGRTDAVKSMPVGAQKSETADKTTLQERREMPRDELWNSLRQGSRNVAGVHWQVDVCAYLLVASYAEELPFVDLIPEGYEDADCTTADGTSVFIQMKELAGGNGIMQPGMLADALAHAEASARGAKIVVITDGSLSSGLSFTGWDTVLGQQASPAIDKVVMGLINRDCTAVEASDILARSHVVRLPHRIRQSSETVLSEELNIHPTVAGIVVTQLSEKLAQYSGAQRHLTSQTAIRVRTSDLAAIIAEVQDSVDVGGLDQAVASGICSPVNFLAPEDIPARSFYLGVDGLPGHVAANLDVVRQREMLACAEGLDSEGSVLLVGPSGSGKSILLWRTARDLVPAARVVRVRRAQNGDDARALARYVKLLRPSESSPVMVVVDNLGRPHTNEWPYAAALLREIPSVLLLGAARVEDFTPDLLAGTTRMVEPQLDQALAEGLGRRLQEQGIELCMASSEAFQRSEGLLLEYIALLTTGQRLQQVLATQIAGLQAPHRRMQREAARLITTAHVLGLSLESDSLAMELAEGAGAAAVAEVGDALGVLRDEHLAVSEGDTWRGLHELRSATISRLLHESPPPRIGTTLARIATLIDPGHGGWMLRRVAELYPVCLPEVIEALGGIFSTYQASAGELAALLEGAERADNACYAPSTLPILEQARPPGISLMMLALLAYSQRNQNLSFDEMGGEFRPIQKLVDQLPRRSDYDTTLPAVCSWLSPEWLRGVLEGADLLEVIRVLEAGYRHLEVPVDLVVSLFERVSSPHDIRTATIWSRLVAACEPHLLPSEANEILGPLDNRVDMMCAADPLVLNVVVEEGGTSVSVTRLFPLQVEEELQPLLPWDIPRAEVKDAVNESTVACLARLKDACPELDKFKITTVTGAGVPYQIQGFQPGHKDMIRTAFPERVSLRQAVGYQAAFRRITSSRTWTEVVAAQSGVAVELTALARELPLRFKPHDHAGRRAAWRSKLADVRRRLGALSPPPISMGSGPAEVHALKDHEDRAEDATTRALRAGLEALDQACSHDDTKIQRPLATAMSLREAADKIDHARSTTQILLQEQGEALPEDLSNALRRSADLAAALHRRPGQVRLVRAKEPLESAVEIWKKVSDEEHTHSSAVLKELLDSVPEVIYEPVEDPKAALWALNSRSWVVMAPFEALEKTLERLVAMDETGREQLGPHIVLLAVSDGDLGNEKNPSTGFLPSSEQRVSLGYGYQLSSSAPGKALPIPPEKVKEWSEVAGLRLLYPSGWFQETTENFLGRSHEAARRRMRRLPTSTPERSFQSPASERLRQPIASSSRFLGATEVETALLFLEEHVTAEEDGNATVYLCDVMVGAMTGSPLNQETQELAAALGLIYLGGLQETAFEEIDQRSIPEERKR